MIELDVVLYLRVLLTIYALHHLGQIYWIARRLLHQPWAFILLALSSTMQLGTRMLIMWVPNIKTLCWTVSLWNVSVSVTCIELLICIGLFLYAGATRELNKTFQEID